ncbi:MAG: 23S rRNA pseudouridine(955/2504/2580) synthase, partial [Sinobacterium sp.]
MSEQQKIQISQGVQRIVVDEEHAGQRLDNFLLAKLKGLPRSRVYRLCRKGEV